MGCCVSSPSHSSPRDHNRPTTTTSLPTDSSLANLPSNLDVGARTSILSATSQSHQPNRYSHINNRNSSHSHVDIRPATPSNRRRSILARGPGITSPEIEPHTHSHDDELSHTHNHAAESTPVRRGNSARAHPNRPLKKPSPNLNIKPPGIPITPSNPTGALTVPLLRAERRAFFDTRVSGRAEIWGLVQTLCGLVEEGKLEEAQGLLEAAVCTCPTGEIWGKRGGVFDEWGECYQVPSWVVGKPRGLVEEEEVGAGDDEEGDEHEKDVELLGGGEKRKELEKPVGKLVKVKVRLSDRGADVVVTNFGMEQSMEELLRRVRDMADILATTSVKFFYVGNLIAPATSLSSHGWREGHVLNAFVFQE
ncbi:hypothetical protein K402DRAFT_390999 [Aulographum hederae CBS 113979]|uniref:DC-UbP/UBTD2 N-terminal domain-containing protein n=1 Tax=Aulographum hederae CBS 113979 TaxID=1176131 RepID=A0A6G1H892_9PEZI|nr:hypothetical protein K402DRAFT_390999 [Aulographum hederae CBS 113979]